MISSSDNYIRFFKMFRISSRKTLSLRLMTTGIKIQVADRYQQIMEFAVLAGPTGSNRRTDQWDFSNLDDFPPSPKDKQINEEERPTIRMCCFRVSSSELY
ncbi:hypothetical protein CDAR_128151 [Caerostris darwini]|uniref:Ycf15 n=1 Tax=Caerostris darwini TaxID=1538125 RepID=A0AAV4VCC0_9ARAC|nr:hypothetical protein CDAR_128151 [Caerostris darwini]